MEEVDRNELCPCGRGKKYKRCCRRKGIKWYRDDDGHYISECDAPIPKELIDALGRSSDRFCKLFGRNPEPDDLISFDARRHGNSYYKSLIPGLRECGMSESWIYAMYRTEGLMPTARNKKYLTQYDLNKFKSYMEEYDKIEREVALLGGQHQSEGSRISISALVLMGNKILDERVNEIAARLTSGFNYFLNYQNKRGGSIEATPCSLAEYASFVAIRAVKTLDSMTKLLEIAEPVSIYALGRSLFESYIFLRASNLDKEFFPSKILPSLSLGEYGFEVEDGVINYKKIKADTLFGPEAPKRSNKSVPKFGNVCEQYGTTADEELRKLFYRYACQFVHIDALTARSYFYEPDLYTEFDESSIAAVCSLSMGVILLEELANLPITPSQQKVDLLFLEGRLAEDLCDCFMILVLDEEQSDKMYEVFLQRLLDIETNNWACKDACLTERTQRQERT